MTAENPQQYLEMAEQLFGEDEVQAAVGRMAEQIERDLGDSRPLVMCVMGGSVVFAGMLLPRLGFPLEFDYVQATRYRDQIEGSYLAWKVMPGENVKGRTVLLLDDILDEGVTLDAIRQACLQQGAKRVVIAVLVEKELNRPKPVSADYVGLRVPDRYVFGCGMDIYGWWRNLPAIYALK
ncbi:MAG TPA: hypoxanthine-guanine phosphoribosyltransferase [Methylophilaceae bacterium]|jgi:hypoxanthine phosphoribosyltransferase